MLPLERVVERVVSLTFSMRASISGLPSRSTRRKRIPVLGGAGRKLIPTLLPLCKPTPSKLTDSRKVCCCSTGAFNNVGQRLGQLSGPEHDGVETSERSNVKNGSSPA